MTNLAFMLSNWYSGATLLAILLNNHSRLVCNGETFPFEYDVTNRDIYTCSCGQHMRDCKFYTATTESLRQLDGSWNDNFRILPRVAQSTLGNRIVCNFSKYIWLRNVLLMPISPLRIKLNTYLAAHERFYEQARQYCTASCYIDGTKSIRRLELFVQYSQGTPIKVIYLIRDARGFCWSYLKNKQLPKKCLPEAVRAWQEYIELVDIFIARYSTVEIITVRYEELCSDLEETLAGICGFLEIDFEKTMIGKPTEHHMLGNRMRSSFDGVIKEDLAWQDNFTQDEVQQIMTMCYAQ